MPVPGRQSHLGNPWEHPIPPHLIKKIKPKDTTSAQVSSQKQWQPLEEEKWKRHTADDDVGDYQYLD